MFSRTSKHIESKLHYICTYICSMHLLQLFEDLGDEAILLLFSSNWSWTSHNNDGTHS